MIFVETILVIFCDLKNINLNKSSNFFAVHLTHLYSYLLYTLQSLKYIE